MQVTVKVNQKEAIRRGYNCNSTVKLEVDVTTLTEPQRQRLAQWFDNGELKISYTHAEIPMPNVDGLVEFLNEDIAKLAKETEKENARKATQAQELIEFRKAFDADPEKHTYWSSNYGTHVKGNPYCSDHDAYDLAYWLTPEQQVVARSIGARHQAEHKAKEAGERQKKAEAEAECKAAVERRKAQLKAFVASVGGLLAERHAEGFATELEIEMLIARTDLEQRGLTYRGSTSDWLRIHCDTYERSLTDEWFTAYKEFKAKLPAGVAITVYELWNPEHDEYEHPIKNTKTDRILVAEASYMVGEIEVKADQQIATLPDVTSGEE